MCGAERSQREIHAGLSGKPFGSAMQNIAMPEMPAGNKLFEMVRKGGGNGQHYLTIIPVTAAAAIPSHI